MADAVTVPGVDPAEARSLIQDLARAALGEAAPEELLLFDDVSDEYFTDPAAAVASGSKDDAVGFGVEFAMLTPFVLTAVTAVVQLLGSVVKDVARSELTDGLKGLLHRARGGHAGADAGPAPLTRDQLAALHRVAQESVRRAGLGADKAALVADAVVGAMARA